MRQGFLGLAVLVGRSGCIQAHGTAGATGGRAGLIDGSSAGECHVVSLDQFALSSLAGDGRLDGSLRHLHPEKKKPPSAGPKGALVFSPPEVGLKP